MDATQPTRATLTGVAEDGRQFWQLTPEQKKLIRERPDQAWTIDGQTGELVFYSAKPTASLWWNRRPDDEDGRAARDAVRFHRVA